MKKDTTRRPPLPPAVRHAAQVVQERFEALLHSTSGPLDFEDDFMSDIERLAAVLARARRDREKQTPEQQAEDENLHWGEAGYLIGVQVGLRLRTPGGVR